MRSSCHHYGALSDTLVFASTAHADATRKQVNTAMAKAVGEIKACGAMYTATFDWTAYDAVDSGTEARGVERAHVEYVPLTKTATESCRQVHRQVGDEHIAVVGSRIPVLLLLDDSLTRVLLISSTPSTSAPPSSRRC